MVRLVCPWCGEREECEFSHAAYTGLPHDDFGADSEDSSAAASEDGDWAERLYFHRPAENPAVEFWGHVYGCGMWFWIVRDAGAPAAGTSFTTLGGARNYLAQRSA